MAESNELCTAHAAHSPEGDCFVCDVEQAREAAQSVEDTLVLRRFQLYPTEVVTLTDLKAWTGLDDSDRLDRITNRLEDIEAIQPVYSGADQPQYRMTEEGVKQTVEHFDRITGSTDRKPEDVELLVDANERAETATRHAGELEQRVEGLEREKAELENQLAEAHRAAPISLDVVSGFLTGFLRLAERKVREIELRVDRGERLLARIRDVVAEFGDTKGAPALNRIATILREGEAMAAGQRFLDEYRREQLTGAIEIGRGHAGTERGGIFRGYPTEHGFRFERIAGEEHVRLSPGDFEALKGDAAQAERRAVAAEERVEELQALVDDVLPAVRELRNLLDGDHDPAWWVRATRALDQLGEFERSPLAVPPPTRGEERAK